MLVRGQCISGEVRYQTPDVPYYIFNCHCTICRDRSGAPFTTSLIYKNQDVENDTDNLLYFESNPNVMRGFCKKCRTDISWINKEKSKWIGLTLGTCKHQNQFKPSKDIWIRSKLEWVVLDPNTDKHIRGPFD